MKVDWTHGDMMTDLADKWQNLPPEEKELHTQKIAALRQRAVMIAQAAGKDLRICEVSEQAAFTPRDWREHLRSFVMNQTKREDYTWARPNKRFVPMGVYLPSMRGTYDPDSIVLAIDNSGSISEEKLEEFLEEIACIMVEMPTTLFHIICCDTRVNAHHKVSSSDLPLDFEVHARGGTRFTPVFVEVEEQGIDPEALIYFTDMGSTDYPSEKPDYPVLWMNYGRVRATNEAGIKRQIEKAKKEYKQYSWHSGAAWTDQEWLISQGFPPFGELTNMKTEENRRA